MIRSLWFVTRFSFYGLWSAVCVFWFVVCGPWFVVCILNFAVCGLQFMVYGFWFVFFFCGLWFVVCGIGCRGVNRGSRPQMRTTTCASGDTCHPQRESLLSLMSFVDKPLDRTPSIPRKGSRQTHDACDMTDGERIFIDLMYFRRTDTSREGSK